MTNLRSTAQQEKAIIALLASAGFTLDDMKIVSLDYAGMSALHICIEREDEEETQYFMSQISISGFLKGLERSGLTGLDADTLIDYIEFKIGDWTMVKV